MNRTEVFSVISAAAASGFILIENEFLSIVSLGASVLFGLKAIELFIQNATGKIIASMMHENTSAPKPTKQQPE